MFVNSVLDACKSDIGILKNNTLNLNVVTDLMYGI